MASSFETDSPKPLILLLALDHSEDFNAIHECFIHQLESKADVQQVTTPCEVRVALTRSPKPAVILSVDASLTAKTRTSLVNEALYYVRAGGVLVFMGLFSSNSRPPDINALFSSLGLPWRTGDYHRSTFELNTSMSHFDTSALATNYSQKAVCLSNVAYEDAVYLPFDDSRVEPGILMSDRTQTPAAFAKLEDGRVGYIGDVNNEDETTSLALGMCGLYSNGPLQD